MTNDEQELYEIPTVNRPTRNRLNERQLVDYTDHKQRLIDWFLHVGKEPEKAEEDARTTVAQTHRARHCLYTLAPPYRYSHTDPFVRTTLQQVAGETENHSRWSVYSAKRSNGGGF